MTNSTRERTSIGFVGTGLVPRFPTAFLAAALMVIAFLGSSGSRVR